MYDNHIFCEEYNELKEYIVDIINGDIVDYDIDELSDHIQELYDTGKMPATQYDELTGYLQDI